MDFRYAMMAPTSSPSNLNSGISGWPEMRPSPKASSSDSIGYRFASVRNNGACGWRLSSVRAVAWQREHSLARRASPRLRAAASWAHVAETAKTMQSPPINSLMLTPYAVHPARRRRHHITMEEMRSPFPATLRQELQAKAVARVEPPGSAGACHRAGPPGPASGRPDGRLQPDPVGRPDDKLSEIRAPPYQYGNAARVSLALNPGYGSSARRLLRAPRRLRLSPAAPP